MQLIKVYSKAQPQYFVIITHDDVSDAVHTVGGEHETMPSDLEGEVIGTAGGGYDHYYAISAENVPEQATEATEPQLDEFDTEIIKNGIAMMKRVSITAYNQLNSKGRAGEDGLALAAVIQQASKTYKKIKIISNEMLRS